MFLSYATKFCFTEGIVHHLLLVKKLYQALTGI